nr:hypothetical protein [Tanacetum cinerariifolium]
MWETNSYKAYEDHMILYEALEKSMNHNHADELLTNLAEARRKKKKRHDSSKTPHGSPPHQPPPPPPPAGPYRTLGSSGASGSSQLPPPSPPPSTSQSDQSKSTPSVSLILEALHMDDDDTAPDEQVHSSDDEDIGNTHIPKMNLKQDWWKPLQEDIPATPEPAWSIPSSDLLVLTNNWAYALASTYTPPPENSLLAQTGDMYQMEECHKLLTDKVDESIIRYNVSKPLPLGGPPGQVTIQSNFFFNKDLEYLRYSSKGGRPALSISKIKVAYYHDVGLEQMVPDQMWIEEEYKYDIAVMYGISRWWFQRQPFYIDRHSSKGDRRAVRTHMRILSVVRIEVFSMYGYDYMKKIVLHRADLNEHIIAERDFKYLYPSDFEDLYLLNLQGIESYQTQLNLTKPRWDATGFEYKHDFTIDEALDYRVKELKVNRMNPGLNTRFWTRKDVDKSKEFMFAIPKWLKTMRIFGNLESFVGGRVRKGDYRLLQRTE